MAFDGNCIGTDACLGSPVSHKEHLRKYAAAPPAICDTRAQQMMEQSKASRQKRSVERLLASKPAKSVVYPQGRSDAVGVVVDIVVKKAAAAIRLTAESLAPRATRAPRWGDLNAPKGAFF